MAKSILMPIFIIMLLFSGPSFSRKFNSCSEKWLYEVNSIAPKVGISVLSTVSVGMPFFWIAVGATSSNTRHKSKAAHLLQSARLMYDFRKKLDLVDLEHKERVRKFYEKYIVPDGLKKLKLSAVIRTLAKYDKIAYDLKRCSDFAFVNGFGTYTYSKSSIAYNIFRGDKINTSIIKKIKEYEEQAPKNLEERKKDMRKCMGDDDPVIVF